MAKIMLAHGSGGKLTHDLIEKVILKKFGNPILRQLTDSAILKLKKTEYLAFTTDSFVVNPIIFKGGDIGKLAVCGTINDLAVCGAIPIYISCSLIIEEGTDELILGKIIDSMGREAKQAGVKIVTGDTKVVERGSVDKVFINTSGIGIVKYNRLSLNNISVGDKVLINGPIADHGISVLLAREELGFKSGVRSDCASLHRLILTVLGKCSNVKFMRDPTRGGLVTTMNEIILKRPQLGVRLFEEKIPLNESTKAACELLGFDPLYIGNEGKFITVLPEQEAQKAVRIMHRDKLGKRAAIIGEVTKDFKGKVVIKSRIGGERIADMLSKEALPRIC
jgi:hydrogenase expression/formation protein HypE